MNFIHNLPNFPFTTQPDMFSRSIFLLFFVGLLVPLISASSLTGSRLLVILEDAEERASYSQFLGDLKGKRNN